MKQNTKQLIIGIILGMVLSTVFALFAIGKIRIKTPAQQTATSNVQTAIGQKIEMLPPHPAVVIIVKRDCHWCQVSMDFYKEVSEISPLVVLTPDDVDTATADMKTSGIKPAVIIHISAPPPGVRGTPNLLIVDGNKTVQQQYVGYLDPVHASLKQAEILAIARTIR